MIAIKGWIINKNAPPLWGAERIMMTEITPRQFIEKWNSAYKIIGELKSIEQHVGFDQRSALLTAIEIAILNIVKAEVLTEVHFESTGKKDFWRLESDLVLLLFLTGLHENGYGLRPELNSVFPVGLKWIEPKEPLVRKKITRSMIVQMLSGDCFSRFIEAQRLCLLLGFDPQEICSKEKILNNEQNFEAQT